jgi:hypothetical protein
MPDRLYWLYLGLVLLAVILALYLAFFSQPAVKRRSLARQARLDYRQARGTAHLKLLREALAREEQTRRQHEQTLAQAQHKRTAIQQEQQARLSLALDRRSARCGWPMRRLRARSTA